MKGPFRKGFVLQESKQKGLKIVSFLKMLENTEIYTYTLTLLHSEWPKL